MLRRRFGWWICCIAMLGWMGAAGAQGIAPSPPTGIVKKAPDATPLRDVTLDVVVDHKNGSPVNETLAQPDFTVLDNGKPRQPTSFRVVHAGEEPMRVIVMVDALNIKLTGLEYARNQIATFLKKSAAKLVTPTALALLTDDGPQMVSGFSQDGKMLAGKLESQQVGMRMLRRSTGIWGAEERYAISLNALQQLAEASGARPGRTVILWVSPGWPLLSGPEIMLSGHQSEAVFRDVVRLSDMLRRDRVTLYALDPIGAAQSLGWETYYEAFLSGVKNPSQAEVGDLSLQVLAIHSGGLALNSNDTQALLARSFADLKQWYEIRLDVPPAERKDMLHTVQVKVNQPGVVARTMDEYYAQP